MLAKPQPAPLTTAQPAPQPEQKREPESYPAPRQQYVVDCETGVCQFALTLELMPGAAVTWYQRMASFTDAECARGWEAEAAASYARCAAALEAGRVTAADLPRTVAEGLDIKLSADRTTAWVIMASDWRTPTGRRAGPAARSTWTVPVPRLIAIFNEAASTIKAIFCQK